MKINVLSTILLSCSISTIYSQIQLTDIWQNYAFYAKKNQPYWLGDTATIQFGAQVSIHHIDDEKPVHILPKVEFKENLIIEDYFLPSKDTSIIGFLANGESLYRHSRKHYVIVYDLSKDSVLYISSSKVYNASFSEDLRYLAFTDQNNMFAIDLHTQVMKQLTDDGMPNAIINGRTDWVHEEEFVFSQAYCWIPSTHQIAYIRYDETDVPTKNILGYTPDFSPTNSAYKYPKAGDKNALTTLNIIDLDTTTDEEIFGSDEDFEYIAKIGIANKAFEFYFVKTNRVQNHIEIELYNSAEKTARIVYTEDSPYYVEIPKTILFTSQGIVLDSYRDGYKHFITIANDSVLTDLTPVNFDVSDLLYLDDEEDCIYFTALHPNPHTQSVCVIKKDKLKILTQATYWSEASVSPNGKYAILSQSNLATPYQSSLAELKKLKPIELLETNEAIKTKILYAGLCPHDFFDIKNTAGQPISCLRILPPNFDSTKTYPLLLHVYGGPGYQLVTNEWNSFDFFYHQLLAQKNCIVVLVDGRGTDGKGIKYRQETYGQLGKLELEDLVTVAHYFKAKPYINPQKIGVWGWSFGGFLASMAITKYPDVFACAIAVAPVTNWQNYDNIYTERYMGLPSKNTKGYLENSPLFYAKNLKGKFLLIHGTADDNVHIENSYMLQQELLKQNKQFDTFYYFNKNHGIYGGSTRLNLYQKMLTFIESNLIADGN